MGAVIIPSNVSQVKSLWCDFYGHGHANIKFLPEGFTEESQYSNFYSRDNTYSNTYSLGWKIILTSNGEITQV